MQNLNLFWASICIPTIKYIFSGFFYFVLNIIKGKGEMDAISIIIIAYGLLWNNSIIWHKVSITFKNPKMHSSIYMMSFLFLQNQWNRYNILLAQSNLRRCSRRNMENKYQECKI